MNVSIQKLICPNCGKKLEGLMDEKGGAKLKCVRCGVIAYSKIVSQRRIKLDITLPIF